MKGQNPNKTERMSDRNQWRWAELLLFVVLALLLALRAGRSPFVDRAPRGAFALRELRAPPRASRVALACADTQTLWRSAQPLDATHRSGGWLAQPVVLHRPMRVRGEPAIAASAG